MSELVTSVGVRGNARIAEIRRLLARFPGHQLEARGVSRRDQAALFRQLVGLKGRLPITGVTMHACRHDEGEGDCTSTLVEG